MLFYFSAIQAEENDSRSDADRTKMLIIVGANMGVILMAGVVGLMCYNKRIHLDIYHKLPGEQIPKI